jgi:hypothetical protein
MKKTTMTTTTTTTTTTASEMGEPKIESKGNQAQRSGAKHYAARLRLAVCGRAWKLEPKNPNAAQEVHESVVIIATAAI